MLNRRDFLEALGLLALSPYTCARDGRPIAPTLVNDIHSRLNPTQGRRGRFSRFGRRGS